MNQINETISIDLTEDDTDVQEPQVQFVDPNNLITKGNMEEAVLEENTHYYFTPFQPNIALCECQDSLLSKNKTKNLLSDSTETATISFIKNLEKENPQVETVFIESDEEDSTKIKPHIKVHNMVTIKSQKNEETEKNYLLSSERATTTTIKQTKSANKTLHKTLDQTSQLIKKYNLPLTVRAISPSKFKQNFAKHCSTIVLQDVTDSSPSRKYLAIPKEVAPVLAKSQGPISINVPGIGPLLIPKPSDILIHQSPPALINFKKPKREQEHLKNNLNEPIYEPLNDSKYCWRYQRNRKRDLDGFSTTDRLGFYKAEQKKTKICLAKYNEIIKKLQSSINIKERALVAIKNTRLKMENIKLVEIDRIKTGKVKDSLENKHKLVKSKISFARREKIYSPKKCNVSPVKLSSSESDSSEMENDLLVTKKVVFINEAEQFKGKKRKRRHSLLTNKYRKKQKIRDQGSQDPLQNKKVHQTVIHNSKVKKNDMLKVRKKLDMLQSGSNKIKKGNVEGKNDKTHDLAIEYPTRKYTKKLSKSSGQNKVHLIKPCHVEITPNNLVQEALEKYNDYTLSCTKDLINDCTIIDNLRQFQSEIQPIKPLLVINEGHCAKMDFQELFCKYNIVFPISDIKSFFNLKIRNMLFVNSAKAGYIKFVKPQILCKYLAGFREM